MAAGGVVTHERLVADVDRFRVQRVADGATGPYLSDRRGRVREWRTCAAAVRALEVSGEDLSAWRVWWVPAGAIGWRSACLASDAGDVFAGR